MDEEQELFGRAMFVYEQALVGKAHFCWHDIGSRLHHLIFTGPPHAC